MTRENLKKIANKIESSRKKKANQTKGKGKCKLILSESEDEEELLATAVDIIKDVAANKISVETQFKRFVDAGAKQGRSKKVKSTNPSVNENIVDLVSTPTPVPNPDHTRRYPIATHHQPYRHLQKFYAGDIKRKIRP